MTTATSTARTTAEITAKVDELARKVDWGFQLGVLVAYLPYEAAKPHLEDGVSQHDWEATQDRTPTREAVIADMREYMEFAWEKATDHRGLSAMRSIEKMKAWLWLLGDEELQTYALAGENYPQYGAPILYRISQKYEFPIPEGQEVRNMAGGQPCSEECQEGCGS